jgi:DNA polymerase III alpha subunit
MQDVWQSTKAEFDNRKLMEMERELLGIYLREHPSQKLLKKSRSEWSKPLSEISDYKGQKISVTAIIKTARTVVTKTKQQEMAFLLLTDEGGEIEAVVFPKTYAQVKSFLIPNSVVIVKGKVEEREDRLSFIVDTIELIPDDGLSTPDSPATADKPADPNTVIVPKGTSKSTLLALNTLLQQNKGEDKITLAFHNTHDVRELVLPFGINYTASLKKQIAQLLQIQDVS